VPSDQTYSTTSLPTVTVNNTPALAPGLAGVYQVAIQIPSSLPDGDWPIQASIGGATSLSCIVITVKK